MELNGTCRSLNILVKTPFMLEPASGSCPQRLSDWFHMNSSVQFTAVVELLGDVIMRNNSDDEGIDSLYVMEPHPVSAEQLVLPCGAEWKDIPFLSCLVESITCRRNRRVPKRSLDYMKSYGFMKDPRYQLGWHARASKFLRSVALTDDAIPTGHVEQVQVTCTSTVIKLNSSKGWYFAKAPALGNMEFTTTAGIAALFPQSSPVVFGTSSQLRCLVTKAFLDMKPKRTEAHAVVAKLADIQLESISHLDELADAGCPRRGPNVIKAQIKTWTESEVITRESLIRSRVEHMCPVVIDLCDKLQSMKVPCTLLHGDLGFSNCSFKTIEREDVMFFDWEFACIGHPFCDFHRLYDELPEDVRDEVVDQYLKRWSEFEDMTRLREAFDIARCLGLLTKLWTVFESLESSEHQISSELQNWCDTLVNFSVSALCVANRLEWCD